MVEESEDQVVVDFAPSAEDSKPEAPEKPETKEDVTNSEEAPTYAAEETTPPSSDAKEDTGNANTPAPGSQRADGAVYDPVFGWVYPSAVEQDVIHNDGDPNKMVGDM